MDYIIGGGFVGCALKTILPNAILISKSKGNVFPLVLIHEFPSWKEFYPNAVVKWCDQEEERGYNVDKYFMKSRGSIPDFKRTPTVPRGFNFLDFDYEEYFNSIDCLNGFVSEIRDNQFKMAGKWVDFNRLFVTIPLSFLGLGIPFKVGKKIVLFKAIIPNTIVSDTNKIEYFSSKIYHRLWTFNSKSIKGVFAEQAIDANFPDNIMLFPPTNNFQQVGVFPGHIISEKISQSQDMALKKRGIYTFGRNARMDYSRIDETIEVIRKIPKWIVEQNRVVE